MTLLLPRGGASDRRAGAELRLWAAGAGSRAEGPRTERQSQTQSPGDRCRSSSVTLVAAGSVRTREIARCSSALSVNTYNQQFYRPAFLFLFLSLLFILLYSIGEPCTYNILRARARAPQPPRRPADSPTLYISLSLISSLPSLSFFLSFSLLSFSLLPELTLGTTTGDASPTMYCPVTRRQRAAPLRRKG